MATIQKAIADIREMRHEEVDLVGGAYSFEVDRSPSYSSKTICVEHGGCFQVTFPDDQIVFGYTD